jgi:TonB family protein
MFILLLILLPIASLGQKKDTVPRYLDADLVLTTKNHAVYYGVSFRKDEHWLLYALYPDNTPLLTSYFKDRELTIKDGPQVVYYPGNKKALECFYRDNMLTGVHQIWYVYGQKKDSGFLDQNHKRGVWKEWHLNGQLKNQTSYDDQYVFPFSRHLGGSKGLVFPGWLQGDFSSWYESGTMESKGNFADNVMEGVWRWFHPNGLPSTIEEYSKGKLVRISCFDTLGKLQGDFCPVARPAVLAGYGDYKEYIMQNLSWPEEAIKKKIEGSVVVYFRINSHGKLDSLSIVSDKPILNQAVAGLFDSMKEWYPAVSHNRNVNWEDRMTIPFFLTGVKKDH